MHILRIKRNKAAHDGYDPATDSKNLRQMDIVVDYGKQQFIIELKRWDGKSRNQKAYEQLCGYLKSKGVDIGYLLTFDFREEGNKVRKAEWIDVDGKRIFDVIV